MIRIILLFCSLFFTPLACAFAVDGASVLLGENDLKQLNAVTCAAYGGIERYEGWKVDRPNLSLSATVYCNATKAQDGYLRRNEYWCDAIKGRWMCQLQVTSLKRMYDAPIDYVYASSSSNSIDSEKVEALDNLIAIYPEAKKLRHSICDISQQENYFYFTCNVKYEIYLLRRCQADSCRWEITYSGTYEGFR